jgi:DNA-binding response OmpR family regulator
MRILAVEDEPRIRELIAEGLQRAGFVVDVFGSLEGAAPALPRKAGGGWES